MFIIQIVHCVKSVLNSLIDMDVSPELRMQRFCLTFCNIVHCYSFALIFQ